MVEAAAKKQADEKRRAERKLRHQQDDLRYALKKLPEPLDANLSYEEASSFPSHPFADINLNFAFSQAVPLIEHLSEYKAIEDEESRRAAFVKFMKRMKERLKETAPSEDGASTSSRRRKEPSHHNDRDRDRDRGDKHRDKERDRDHDRRSSRHYRDDHRRSGRDYDDEKDHKSSRDDRDRKRGYEKSSGDRGHARGTSEHRDKDRGKPREREDSSREKRPPPPGVEERAEKVCTRSILSDLPSLILSAESEVR